MREEAFDSVWDAIEDDPVEVASLKARSGILIAIQDAIDGWALHDAAAAKRLGVTSARLKDLRSGNVNAFSLDDLVRLAATAGLAVTLDVRPAAA